MSNMTAYETLSGFINYFMYNATDYTKEDIARALSTLSSEFNDDTAAVLKKENARLKSERDKFAYNLGVSNTKNGELLRLLKKCKFVIEEHLIYEIGSEQKQELLTKIEKALKAGKRITSNGMPSHCFL